MSSQMRNENSKLKLEDGLKVENNTIDLSDPRAMEMGKKSVDIVERIFLGIPDSIFPVPNHKLQLFCYGDKVYGYTIGYDNTDLWMFVCKSVEDFHNNRGKIIHYPYKSKDRLCLKKRTIVEALYDLG